MDIMSPVRKAIGELVEFASDYIIAPLKQFFGRWVSTTSSEKNIPEKKPPLPPETKIDKRKVSDSQNPDSIDEREQLTSIKRRERLEKSLKRSLTRSSYEDLPKIPEQKKNDSRLPRNSSSEELFKPVASGGIEASMLKSSEPVPREEIQITPLFEEAFSPVFLKSMSFGSDEVFSEIEKNSENSLIKRKNSAYEADYEYETEDSDSDTSSPSPSPLPPTDKYFLYEKSLRERSGLPTSRTSSIESDLEERPLTHNALHLARSYSTPSSSDEELGTYPQPVYKSISGTKHQLQKTKIISDLVGDLEDIKKEELDDSELKKQLEDIAKQSLGPGMLRALANEGLIQLPKDNTSDSDIETGSSEDENPVFTTEESSNDDSGLGSSSGSESEKSSEPVHQVKITLAKKERLIEKNKSLFDKLFHEYVIPEEDREPIKQKTLHSLTTTKITKEQLSSLIRRSIAGYKSPAEKLMQKTADLLEGDRPSPIKPEDILELTKKPRVTRGQVAALETLVKLAQKTIACTNINPYTPQTTATISQHLTSLEETLQEVNGAIKSIRDIEDETFWGADELDDEYLIKQTIAEDLKNIATVLQEKAHSLSLIQQSDFRQEADIHRNMQMLENLAISTLLERLQSKEDSYKILYQEKHTYKKYPPQRTAIKIKMALLRTEIKHLEKTRNELILLRDSFPIVPNDDGIIKDAVKKLKKYESSAAELLESVDLKDEYEDKKIKHLNKTGTETIERAIPVQVDGKMHVVHSSATPAHKVRFHLNGNEGNHEPYKVPYNGEIRNSATRDDPDHARNYYIQITKDEKGRVIEKVHRLGIPSRFWEKDAKQRKEDIKTVWKEVMVAGLAEDHENIPNFDTALDTGPENAIELPLSYTCLLSPDMFRKVTGFHENEHQMAEESIDALLAMADIPIQLEMRDSQGKMHTIWVKPDPVALILPMNQLAFSKTQQHLLRTFDLADKHNKKTAKKLFGDLGRKEKKGRGKTNVIGGSVGRFLQEHTELSSLEREQIEAISIEMARIIHNKLYHQGGVRPNYLGWLHQELCRLTKRQFIAGCKSGKDRTGNFCTSNTVESSEFHFRQKASEELGVSKSVAELMNFGHDLKTRERILNMNTAIHSSPSMKVTEYCVGFPGLKCDDTAMGLNNSQLVDVKN